MQSFVIISLQITKGVDSDENIHQTEEFNSTIGSTDPVIIKFEADWCPDCKAMDMWIDQLLKI